MELDARAAISKDTLCLFCLVISPGWRYWIKTCWKKQSVICRHSYILPSHILLSFPETLSEHISYSFLSSLVPHSSRINISASRCTIQAVQSVVAGIFLYIGFLQPVQTLVLGLFQNLSSYLHPFSRLPIKFDLPNQLLAVWLGRLVAHPPDRKRCGGYTYVVLITKNQVINIAITFFWNVF